MGIDINMFRKDKGNDPEQIKEIQRKRFKDQVEIDRVDLIVDLDKKWRAKDYELNQLNKEINSLQKEIGQKMKNKETCDDLVQQSQQLKDNKSKLIEKSNELHKELNIQIRQIGNLLHQDVIISKNEDENGIVRTWGQIPDIKVTQKPGFAHHHQVLAMLEGYDPVRGSKVAGHRGYFLKGVGAMLNMALINYGMQFLNK